MQAPYRDRKILAIIAELLHETGRFDHVATTGPPEDVGQSAEFSAMVTLEIISFEAHIPWTDYTTFPLLRTVRYALTIYARDPDPDARDNLADLLFAVASNALNGVSYGGETIDGLCLLGQGTYQPATGVERRLKVTGQFAYEIPDLTAYNTDA